MQCLAKPGVCALFVNERQRKGFDESFPSRMLRLMIIIVAIRVGVPTSAHPIVWWTYHQMIIYDPSSSATATHTVFTFCLGLGFWLRRASESRNHEFRRRSQTSQRFWSQMSPRSYGQSTVRNELVFEQSLDQSQKSLLCSSWKKVEKKDWNWRKKPAKNGKRTKHGQLTENDK